MTPENDDFLKALLARSSRPLQEVPGAYDENDVAAAFHGKGGPFLRREIEAAASGDPLLAQALDFEKSFARTPAPAFRRAAAAILILLGLGAAVHFAGGGAPGPSDLLALGRYSEAIQLLEGGSSPQDRELLVLARFASNAPDPLRGLEAGPVDYPFLPPAEQVLRSVGRQGPGIPPVPRLAFLGGYIHGPDFVLTVVPDPERTSRVVLYGESRTEIHASVEIPPGGQPVPWAPDHPLAPLARYGVEIWNLDGERLDHREFQAADEALSRAAGRRIEALRRLLPPDSPELHAAVGNTWFHFGFYDAALQSYERIPPSRRSPGIARQLAHLRP